MRTTRLFLSLAAAGLLLVVTAGAAAAHVTIPGTAAKGGFGIVTFSVPNERDDASTVKLEVQLPKDTPLAFVSAQPKPGWTVTTTKRTLDTPIDAFGEKVTEVVDTVTWEGGAVAPGQFDTFSLSVGSLPTDEDQVAFPAIQTYSSGEQVAWIESDDGGAEPEHPAPELHLVAPTAADHVDAPDDATDATGLATGGLVVGILALIVGGLALGAARRNKPTA
jgi:uncharacterized protein YcnI